MSSYINPVCAIIAIAICYLYHDKIAKATKEKEIRRQIEREIREKERDKKKKKETDTMEAEQKFANFVKSLKFPPF